MATAVKVRSAFAAVVPSLATAYVGYRAWDHGSVTLNDDGAKYGTIRPAAGTFRGGANQRKILAELYAYFNGESQYWTVVNGESGSTDAQMVFSYSSQGVGERGFIVKSKTEDSSTDCRFLFLSSADASWRNEFEKKFRDVTHKGHDPGTFTTCSTYRGIMVGMDTACQITGVLTASAGNTGFSGLAYDQFGGSEYCGYITRLKILETADWFFIRGKDDYSGSTTVKTRTTVYSNYGTAYRGGVFCGKIESPGVYTTRNVVCGGAWTAAPGGGYGSYGRWGSDQGRQSTYETSAGRCSIGFPRPDSDISGLKDTTTGWRPTATASYDGTNYNLHKCAFMDNYGDWNQTKDSIMIGTFPCILIGPERDSRYSRAITSSALLKTTTGVPFAANMSGSFYVYDDGQVVE
tara:strand:+ start:746 stop:1963 length:1218 start_codon:yes stop_codon:yes gene_type:complete